jgi:hypothetical protein
MMCWAGSASIEAALLFNSPNQSSGLFTEKCSLKNLKQKREFNAQLTGKWQLLQ